MNNYETSKVPVQPITAMAMLTSPIPKMTLSPSESKTEVSKEIPTGSTESSTKTAPYTLYFWHKQDKHSNNNIIRKSGDIHNVS